MATVTLTKDIYHAAAIDAAIDAFSDHCNVTYEEHDKEFVAVISPATGMPPAVREEFLNYLLNLSIEYGLSEA